MNSKTYLILMAMILALVQYFDIAYDILLVSLLYLVSYSAGSMIRLRGGMSSLDRVAIHLAAGFGAVGFFLWLTTFYNLHYTSFYIFLSLILLVYRHKQILAVLSLLRKATVIIASRNSILIYIIVAFVMLYLVAASYPIGRSDVSVKHLAIPASILNKTHWDYNIIEANYFAEWALLSHMLSLYLLALKGTKALQLFVVSLAFLTMFILLRIATRIDRSPLLVNGVAILFLSTPAVFMFTTSMMCDIYPVFFAAVLLLFLYRFKPDVFAGNSKVIAFIMGSTLFSKQSATYFVFPILIFLVGWMVLYAIRDKKPILRRDVFYVLITATALFLLPILPPLLLIWYKTGSPIFPFANGFFKSIYFTPTSSFDLTWEEYPIKFTLHSFVSMILHTSRHWQWSDGGFGYIPLLFLFSPLLILKRNKVYLLLAALTVASFWFSTRGASNARYRLGTILFALPVCIYLLEYCFSWIRMKTVRYAASYGLLVLFALPNIHYILTPKWLTFSPLMLKPNKELTLVENEVILFPINRKGVRLLSNNDPARGVYKGEFYTLTWYNTYLIDKVLKKEVSPAEFMKAYDYYLIRKDLPLIHSELFAADNKELARILQKVAEDERYVLYSVDRQAPIVSKVFEVPLEVTINKPVTINFANNFSAYRIVIEAEKLKIGDATGRFQINWTDNSRKQAFSIELFKLVGRKNTYVSSLIENVPPDANSGVMFLTSHDGKPILIHSCKLIGINERSDYLSKELAKYGRKWPYLSN